MKILFGIQGTGNGHLSRAKEIIPILEKYGEVDLLVSSTDTEVNLPHKVKYYKHGIGFIFGQKGGIDFGKTLKGLKPIRFLNDIRQFDIKSYDIVINDYEPITSWACKLRGIPCHGLSHQGAYLSDKSPRPKQKKWYGELLLKNYSPVSTIHAFHFSEYDDFIHTPVIRSGIRQTISTYEDHIAVYLPALSDKRLVSVLSKLKETHWKVFSKRAKEIYTNENITIYPVSGIEWENALASCEGALMGAGFEGPAEALFLQKKLLVIPMIMQYEQECNAASLEEIGVRVIWKLNATLESEIRHWLKNDKVIPVNYPDKTAAVVQSIFDKM
jgi:uncharacterized protein (TIGR00661 family)